VNEEKDEVAAPLLSSGYPQQMSQPVCTVSLWLSGLKSYAQNFGDAVHMPHINLVSGIRLPIEQVISELKRFSQSLSFETLNFVLSPPSQSSSTTKLEISRTTKPKDIEALDNLRHRLAQGMSGFQETDHCVVYFQGTPNERTNRHFPSGLTEFSFEADGIDVMSISKDGSVIRHVGRSPLKSSFFFRSSNYIDGEWTPQVQKNWLPVIDPATKRIFHYVPSGTVDDVNSAVAAAKRAFPHWRATTAQERARYLLAIAKEIESNQDEIARMEVLDNGKPLKEALIDVSDTVACFRYYANAIIQLENNEQNKKIEIEGAPVESFVRYEPIGVCGLIIPWNYPILMAAWKVAPCLAAGCSCVLKPSELTPITALELAAIAHKVGLPRGVLNVVTGYGPEAGGPLSSHPDVRKVAFTGSIPTGSKIMANAARDIKKVTLELGGKSSIIVFNDVDIDAAVEWIMMGIFFNQGQVCSATSRLLVHEDIKSKLLARLVEEAKKIKLGNGFDPDVTMGPLISESQYLKVLNYIRKGIEDGAKLLCGGLELSEQRLKCGYFVEPTIFDEVSTNSVIWREEIFGPVLCVRSFRTAEEAIQLANDTHYGLAAAVMSKDKELCYRIAKELEAGVVWINCSQPTFIQAPWGGMKQSGFGRELGPWGLYNYLEVKQITVWNDPQAKTLQWYIKSSL
jgi:betaine-aldehyde dehydrogenase